MKLTACDKIMKFIDDEYKAGNRQEVVISKSNISRLGISDAELVKELHRLAQNDYIRIIDKSVHNNLNKPWRIEPLIKYTDYYQRKTEHNQSIRREKRGEVRAWITLAVSILALLVSLFSIYLQFSKTNEEAFSTTETSFPSSTQDITLPETYTQEKYNPQ